MQISLLPEEVDFIYQMISDSNTLNWVGPHILDKIRAKRKQEAENAKCQHEEGRYVGFKVCCTKCGNNFKEGHGETWELIVEKEKK